MKALIDGDVLVYQLGYTQLHTQASSTLSVTDHTKTMDSSDTTIMKCGNLVGT